MIAEWIAREMADRGMIQRDLEEPMGWTQSATSKVLKGRRRVTAEELVRLMTLFGYGNPLIKTPEDCRIVTMVGRLDARHRAALAVYLEALTGGSAG